MLLHLALVAIHRYAVYQQDWGKHLISISYPGQRKQPEFSECIFGLDVTWERGDRWQTFCYFHSVCIVLHQFVAMHLLHSKVLFIIIGSQFLKRHSYSPLDMNSKQPQSCERHMYGFTTLGNNHQLVLGLCVLGLCVLGLCVLGLCVLGLCILGLCILGLCVLSYT